MFCDQLASLGRHAQLTRCFSAETAVAELLVLLVNKSFMGANVPGANVVAKKQGRCLIFHKSETAECLYTCYVDMLLVMDCRLIVFSVNR